jgi:hypothetical protein
MNIQILNTELIKSIEPGYTTFVLIDPLVGEPIRLAKGVDLHNPKALNDARSLAWRRPVQLIELCPKIELPTHQHPYLVELQGSNDSWVSDTISMASNELKLSQTDGLVGAGEAAHRIGGWLKSSQTSVELARQLSDMMKVNTEAVTDKHYQRIADRRVLGWLRHVVGDGRVFAQLGRIQSWHYLDTCGVLAKLCSPSETVNSLLLNKTEWQMLMQSPLLHATVARWLGEYALGEKTQQHSLSVTASSCYMQASAALENAQAAARRWPERFTQAADHIGWAAFVLLHPDIDERPDLFAALELPPKISSDANNPDEPLETFNAMLSRDMFKHYTTITPSP